MVTLCLFLLVTILVMGNAQEINKVQKCCPKGMQLDSNIACVREEGRESSSEKEEEFNPPIDEIANYWIPPHLQNNSLLVQYSKLGTFQPHFLSMKQYEESEDFSDFYGLVHPYLIKADQDCFDTLLEGKDLLRVRVKSLGVKPIFKCCQKGQKLNELFNKCESISDTSAEKEIGEEKISVLDSRHWLPGNYSHQFLLVQYNALHTTNVQYNYVIPEESLKWEMLSSFPTWNAMLLISGTDISGKNITGATNHFCFDEVTKNSLTHRVLLAHIPIKRAIYKCCPYSMYYDLTTNSCVKRQVTNDLLQANVQKQLLFPLKGEWEHNWIPPPFLRSPDNLYTSHSALNNVRYYYITVFLKNFSTIEYDNLDGLYSALVRKTVFCYEATINPFLSLVSINGFITKPINKCCAFGERLNPQLNACIPISDYKKETLKHFEEEWFQPTQPWFPLKSPELYYPVTSNYLKRKYVFDAIEVNEDDNKWKFIVTNTDASVIQLQSQDINNNSLSGSTDKYCFDEFEKGNTSSRVLLAVIYHAYKCCPKGAEMNSKFQCTERSGYTWKDIANEQIEWSDNANDYWIPNSFRGKNITVMYGDTPSLTNFKDGGMFTNESNWELTNDLNNIPTLSLFLSDLNGNENVIKTQRFCFDYLSNVDKVVVYMPFTGQYALRKCCLPGEVLSPRGTCVKHDGVDWSPGNSNFSHRLSPSSFKEHILFPLSVVCSRYTFYTYSPLSSRSESYFKGKYKDFGRYTQTLYCNDWQMTYGGRLEEAIGACTTPESGRILEKVRPLGFVAIFFLLMAAVVAVVKEDSRRSAHGRALVSHALSIAAYVAIQMVVYLTPSTAQSSGVCLPYAYSAYFFMAASNWWLMVFTFNVFSNFRKPLGALAVKAKNDSKERRAVWQRFGVMSLVAWGGAGVVTAITIGIHKDAGNFLKKGLIVPTFWETRTCADEYIEQRENGKYVGIYFNSWGTFCYHFLPTTLLITCNIVFVVLTSLNIRKMSQGTSILRRDAGTDSACVPWHRMERVLIYAKLLLMTGFLELVLEIASWTTGFQKQSDNYEIWASKAFIFLNIATVLDVFRGILVFWLSTGRKFEVVKWLVFVRSRLNSAWQRMKFRIYEIARNLQSRRVEPQKDDPAKTDVPIQELQNLDNNMKRENEIRSNTKEGTQ